MTPTLELRREKDTEALIDTTAVLERIDGDRQLLGEITAMFFEDCPHWLAEIREGIRFGDADRLKRAAHTLRGAVANFGAGAAERAAYTLEVMGRSGNLASAEDPLLILEAALDRLRPALAGFITSTSPYRPTDSEHLS